MENLILQGKFRLAILEAKELLKLNENDNLGIRYILMGLYAYFEDEESALALYEKYSEDSAFMLIPLVVLYYKKEDDRRMRNYIRKLKKNNRDLLPGLDMFMGEDTDGEIYEKMYSNFYEPYSAEEVILALSQSGFLHMNMYGFLERLYEEVLKK